MPRPSLAVSDLMPASGYVLRSSRPYPRTPEIVCYSPDDYHRAYSYHGVRVVDGTLLHVWRVRPARPPVQAADPSVVQALAGLETDPSVVQALALAGLETDLSAWSFRPYYVFSAQAVPAVEV